jgi:uncharacterized membrane protein
MTWFSWALLNALFLSLYGLLTKFLVGKVPLSIRLMAVYGVGLAITGVMWWFEAKKGEALTLQGSMLGWLLLMALCSSLAIFALQTMFNAGAPLSLGNTIARVATIVFSVVLGLLFFKEVLSIKIVLGLALSVAGLWLLTT